MHTLTIDATDRSINVGQAERTLSALVGAFMLSRTVKEHKGSVLLLAAAGYLLYRAFSGHCSVYALLEKTQNPHEEPRAPHRSGRKPEQTRA